MFNHNNSEIFDRYYSEMVKKPSTKFQSPWILQRCMAIVKSNTSSYHKGINHIQFCSVTNSYENWCNIINIRNSQKEDFTGRRKTNEQIQYILLHQYVKCRHQNNEQQELLFTREDIEALNKDISLFVLNAFTFHRQPPPIAQPAIAKNKQNKQGKKVEMQNGVGASRRKQKQQEQYNQIANNRIVSAAGGAEPFRNLLGISDENNQNNPLNTISIVHHHQEVPEMNPQELGLNQHLIKQSQLSKNQDFTPRERQENENNQRNKLAEQLLIQKQKQSSIQTGTKREDGLKSEILLYLHPQLEVECSDQHRSPNGGGISNQNDLQEYFQLHQPSNTPCPSSQVSQTQGKSTSQQIKQYYPPSAHQKVQMDHEENQYLNSLRKESSLNKQSLVFDIYKRQDDIFDQQYQASRISVGSSGNSQSQTEMIKKKLQQLSLVDENEDSNNSVIDDNNASSRDNDYNLSLHEFDIEMESNINNHNTSSNLEANRSITNIQPNQQGEKSNDNNDEDFNDDIEDVKNEEYLSCENPQDDCSEYQHQQQLPNQVHISPRQHHQSHSLSLPFQPADQLFDIPNSKHFPSSEKYLQSMVNYERIAESQQSYTGNQQNFFNQQSYQNMQQEPQQMSNPFMQWPLQVNYSQQGIQNQQIAQQQCDTSQQGFYGVLPSRQYSQQEQLQFRQQQQQQQQQQCQPFNYYALFQQQQEMNKNNQGSQQIFTQQNR